MDDNLESFLASYFSPELAEDRERIHANASNWFPHYRAAVKTGLAELLRTRSLSLDEFCLLTDASYDSEDDVYADIARAYESIFGDSAPTTGTHT